MVALRRRVKEQRIEQLKYWRGIRLDNPSRKTEALRHIDNLLDEMLAEKETSGGTGIA